MQQPMTFNIEQSIHSIRSGLRRRHAISRLNRGLARFTETELEDLLSKADIRRSELFTGFKGNAVHRQLMGRMLAHRACLASRRRAEGATCIRFGGRGGWGQDHRPALILINGAAWP